MIAFRPLRALSPLGLGLALAALPAVALAQDATPAATPTSDGDAVRVFDLPGEAVFPEGVAYDPNADAFYVGSAADGTIFRGDLATGAVEIFSPSGADGRTTAIGMKVDAAGLLYVAGGTTGLVWVYDTAAGTLVGQFDNGLSPDTFLNDIALTPSGAYVTDSFNAVLYRAPGGGGATPIAGAGGQLEIAIDFTGTAYEFGEGFNSNGIVADPTGQILIVIQSSTGNLFRVDLASQAVSQVDLGGDTLEAGDGLALAGDTLYVVRNAAGLIVPVVMNADLTAGVVGEGFTDPALAYPTTIAPYNDNGCLLVVNSQFDQQQGGQPVLPFTVAGIPIPAAAVAGGTPTAGASPIASPIAGGC